MNRLSLKFLSNEASAELFESEFSSPLLGRTLRCVRGRQTFTDSVEGSFQWTSAVQSMSAVAVKSKIAGLTPLAPASWPQSAGINSDSTSWALTLDFAISKKPRWLLDMFGVDQSGIPIVKRLFIRMNPEKKRPGPVWVSINPAFLGAHNIAIFLDGNEVRAESELTALLKLIGLDVRNSPDHVSTDRIKHFRHPRPATDRMPLSQNDDEAELPLSETFLADRWWLRMVSKILRDEITSMLADSSIFRPELLERELQSIYDSPAYRPIAARNVELTSDIDLKLNSSARLGIIEPGICNRTFGALGRPLNISIALTLAPSLVLLSYLQHEQGFPLAVNYRYAHSFEIIRAIETGASDVEPDCMVLGLVPAIRSLSRRRRLPYKPLMFMPKASNRLISPRQPGASRQTRFVLPSDLPTSASFIFDSLLAGGQIARRSTKIHHLEPDEIVVKTQKASDDFRSILWFPHYNLNHLLSGCQVFSPDSITLDLPTILLVHERLLQQVDLATALDVALRDAWLRLRRGGALLDRVIKRLVADPEYLDLFTRYTGLYALDETVLNQAKESSYGGR